MRDITLEDTIRIGFTTRQFSDGVPTTLSGTPILSVLEENNATPITAGVSVSVDRASVTGLNEATIAATAVNGYESGKSYSVYISTGTVGGVSVVGEVIGQFTIALSAAVVEIGASGAGLTDLGGMSTTMKAQVNTEVVDTLDTDTYAESSDVPAATATLVQMVHWLFTLARNKGTQTSTTKTLRDDADGVDIGTSAISDDGTVFTRNKWS